MLQPSFERKILQCVSAVLPDCSKELSGEAFTSKRGRRLTLAVTSGKGEKTPHDWLSHQGGRGTS